jgi:parallel beta-helix repeat protein
MNDNHLGKENWRKAHIFYILWSQLAILFFRGFIGRCCGLKKKLLLIPWILILLSLSPVFLEIGINSRPNKEPLVYEAFPNFDERIHRSSFESHDQIIIYGDDDFVEQGWPGSGTSEDPYIIEGYEIVSDYDCIAIHSTTVHFVVRNCYVRALAPSEHRDGIKIQSADYGVVEGCIVEMKGNGLYVLLSSNVVLRNNTVRNTPDYGIHISSSSSCEIYENTVYNVPSQGIDAFTISDCIIGNNSLWDCEAGGISLYDSSNNIVENNIVHDCGSNAISLETCTSCVFRNNTVFSNAGPGFYNYDSDQCDLIDNEIYDNEEGGIYWNRGDYCKWEGNYIHDNHQIGAYLYYGLLCNLTNNNFENDGLYVLGVAASDWNHYVSGNTVNGKSLGYFFGISDIVIDGGNYGQVIIADCHRLKVQGGVIGNSDIGVSCYLSSNITIDSLSINNEFSGIYLYSSADCNVSSTTMIDCGVSIIGGQLANWLHNFTGTTVNGLPVSYCLNEDGTLIDGSIYGQAIIVNSTNIQLVDGNFVNASQGVSIAFSSNCKILRNTIDGGFNGLRIRECQDSHFENNSITNSLERAVLLYYSEGCTFTNNTISNSEIGMYLYYSQNCRINESSINQNIYGIYSSYSTHLNFSRNLEEGNVRGIQLSSSSYSTIRSDTIRANELYGISAYSSNYIMIKDCIVEDNGDNGIYFSSSFNGSIIHNEVIQNGYDGISIWTSDGFNIINNTASKNVDYGILIHHFSENNRIYGNTITDNIFGNGYDYESENSWDDGISVGNYWSDYIGPGPYYLDGPGNNMDNYPSGPAVILIIHNDVSYHLGTNPILTWNSFSSEPDYFIIYRDGEIHKSGIWDGHDVSTSVATDSLGVFNYTLFINGTSGQSKTNTVMVTIYDNPPTIDSPMDKGYNFDTTGHTITWHPFDLNPFGYYIYQDGSLASSNSWSGSNVQISVDGLSIGVHYFMLVVNDTSDNKASDTVQVTVWDTEPWLDSPYGDIQYIESTLGNFIYWDASDLNPANYTVYRNSTILTVSTWNGEAISYNVDGLIVGAYNYTLKVTDTSGQAAYDTVFVTVLPATPVTTTTSPPTTNSVTTPPPINTTLLIVGAGVAGVVIIAAAICIRRR